MDVFCCRSTTANKSVSIIPMYYSPFPTHTHIHVYTRYVLACNIQRVQLLARIPRNQGETHTERRKAEETDRKRKRERKTASSETFLGRTRSAHFLSVLRARFIKIEGSSPGTGCQVESLQKLPRCISPSPLLLPSSVLSSFSPLVSSLRPPLSELSSNHQRRRDGDKT